MSCQSSNLELLAFIQIYVMILTSHTSWERQMNLNFNSCFFEMKQDYKRNHTDKRVGYCVYAQMYEDVGSFIFPGRRTIVRLVAKFLKLSQPEFIIHTYKRVGIDWHSVDILLPLGTCKEDRIAFLAGIASNTKIVLND